MSVQQLTSLSGPVAVPQPPRHQTSHDEQQIPSSRLLSVLARRKWVVIACVLAIVPIATWIIYQIPGYFDSSATLTINTKGAAFRDLQATVESSDSDAITIGTQVGIIRSPAMALRVVDKLDLIHARAFADKLAPKPGLLARLGALVGIALPPQKLLSDDDKRQIAAQLLSRMVTIQNDGHSYIVTILASTADPALSAAIANTFSELYLDFNRQLKIAAIQRANSLLDVEMAPVRDHLHAADEAVEAYRLKNGLITGGNGFTGATKDVGSTVSEAQLAQINQQLTEATGDLALRRANLRQIQAALRSGQLNAIPEVVGSPLISTLRAQQTEIASRVASLSQTALSDNPALKSALAADANITSRINAEVSKIGASVASQAAAAQARVDSLRADLRGLQGTVAGESRANVTLRQLEGEATAARAVYQDYLSRFEHTSSDSALQEPEADLISAAMVPLTRAGPPRGELIAASLILSLIFGTTLALILDRMRQGIRTLEQLEFTTGLFGLGLVPIAPRGVRREFTSGSASVYTAAVGLIANVMRFGGDHVRARVVLVTSAAPGEGKTVFAISLAANVGREGGRALLIDCDLHRPSIARELGLKKLTAVQKPAGEDLAQTGDQDRFKGHALPQISLREDVLPGLDVITFEGKTVQWTTEYADALRHVTNDARERYDLVVLDTPPVLAFADAPILSLQADGAIMVVRWRHTPVAATASALRMLRAYGVRVLGGVMTQVKIEELDPAEGAQAHLYRTHAKYFRH